MPDATSRINIQRKGCFGPSMSSILHVNMADCVFQFVEILDGLILDISSSRPRDLNIRTSKTSIYAWSGPSDTTASSKARRSHLSSLPTRDQKTLHATTIGPRVGPFHSTSLENLFSRHPSSSFPSEIYRSTMVLEKETQYSPLTGSENDVVLDSHELQSLRAVTRAVKFWRRCFFVLLGLFTTFCLLLGLLLYTYPSVQSCHTAIREVVPPYCTLVLVVFIPIMLTYTCT